MRQGRIYKNASGRYQLENDTYYWTSGDGMTIYDADTGCWLDGRVEYGSGYYWTNDEEERSLYNGLEVRVED